MRNRGGISDHIEHTPAANDDDERMPVETKVVHPLEHPREVLGPVLHRFSARNDHRRRGKAHAIGVRHESMR